MRCRSSGSSRAHVEPTHKPVQSGQTKTYRRPKQSRRRRAGRTWPPPWWPPARPRRESCRSTCVCWFEFSTQRYRSVGHIPVTPRAGQAKQSSNDASNSSGHPSTHPDRSTRPAHQPSYSPHGGRGMKGRRGRKWRPGSGSAVVSKGGRPRRAAAGCRAGLKPCAAAPVSVEDGSNE
jgi:hypothetical protein